MADHRHSRFLLHAFDQAAAAARHDHIDRVFIPRACSRPPPDQSSARSESPPPAGPPRADRGQTSMNRATRMSAFRSAAQDDRVAGLQAQRAGIGGHVRATLINDAHDTERHAHTLDPQAVRARPLRDHGTDRIRQRGDVFEPLAPSLRPLRRSRREPIDHRGRQVPAVACSTSMRLAARMSEHCSRIACAARVRARSRTSALDAASRFDASTAARPNGSSSSAMACAARSTSAATGADLMMRPMASAKPASWSARGRASRRSGRR